MGPTEKGSLASLPALSTRETRISSSPSSWDAYARSQPLASSLPIPSRYVGLDIGLGEIVEARRKLVDAELMVASAYRLPVADRSFDLVLACEVMEHLEDPAAALVEVSAKMD